MDSPVLIIFQTLPICRWALAQFLGEVEFLPILVPADLLIGAADFEFEKPKLNLLFEGRIVGLVMRYNPIEDLLGQDPVRV